ncbi:uncharacterized protein EV422DRAFT_271257 [Fimicolochytrium jonesii]|uniref:uncharacterized protein n=1 Tax=Fimicolochytrium jonesii TaxID=1396493 RepID=UPI0022FDF58A|nr:uncharacterized protein EV422DRAFT_271257 [Fimicolochytrium jonesii]KAI8816833.1 hypothetical protein EV422DRAFT_271257 [Fimicolochytrium jonesii]
MTDTPKSFATDVNTVEAPREEVFEPKKSAGFWTRKRKIWAGGCAGVTIVLLVVLLPIIFFVIVPKVAQSSINNSKLTFSDVSITNPQNSTFNVAMKIEVTDAGHTDATVTNTSPLTVYWVGGIDPADMTEKPLLEMNMGSYSVSGGKATIEQNIENAKVLDEQIFTAFNKFLVVSPTFKWRMVGDVSVHAVGRTYEGLKMDKVVEVKGMDQLKGASIKEFQPLAAPNPAAPLPIAMNATLINPSPIGIELTNVLFNVTLIPPGSTTPIFLGTALSTGTTLLKGSGETKMPLRAELVPTVGLPPLLQSALGLVLSGQLNTKLTVVPVSVNAENPVSWINNALRGLPLEAELGKKEATA